MYRFKFLLDKIKSEGIKIVISCYFQHVPTYYIRGYLKFLHIDMI